MVIIPTALGNAVRPQSDFVESDDGKLSLRQEASCCLIPVGSPLDREALSVVMYTDADLPDPLRARTEICNVCGYVSGFSALCEHPAWRTVRSTLGRFREAYSLRGGNLLFLRGKLIFKGATDRDGVYATVTRMLAEPQNPTLKAYLIIATAYMRRNLFVNSGCLLEEMLERFAWCRVVGRYGARINGLLRALGTMRSWNEIVARYDQAKFESVSDNLCDQHCYGETPAGECCKWTLLVCPAERLVRCWCCSYGNASDFKPLLHATTTSSGLCAVNTMQARGDV